MLFCLLLCWAHLLMISISMYAKASISKRKQDPIVIKIKEEIDRLYADGRTTLMGDEELEQIIDFYYPRLRNISAE